MTPNDPHAEESIRVLALDPDAAFLGALHGALAARGFELVHAADASAAIEALRADPDGFDVLAVGDTIARDVVLRAREVGADQAVVLVTDRASVDRVTVEARSLGALHVIERSADDIDRAVLTLGAAATCARLARQTRLLKELIALSAVGDVAAPGTEGDVDWTDIPYGKARELAIQTFERRYVARLLRKADGNLAQASRLARLDRSNLRRLLMRLGLRAEAWRSAIAGE
jgi:ActR/RegA family two-component response regulator